MGTDPIGSAIPPVLGEDDARRAAEQLLGFVTGDDAVVNFEHAVESTVRFSGNAIAQDMCRDRLTVGLTVAFGNRRGTATVDAIDEESLRNLARRAEAIARVAPSDPEFLPSLGPQEYARGADDRPDLAALAENTLEETAHRVIAPVAAAGLEISGTVEGSVIATGVATSNGLHAFHAATRAAFGCTVATGDSTGWARDVAPRFADLDPAGLVAKAVATAQRGRAPRAIQPGRYTTVFLPSAVIHLAGALVGTASARHTFEGLTHLSGRTDLKLAADGVTIRSDPADPRFPVRPFDDSGVPKRAATWIDRGHFGQMSWDRWTAHDHGIEPVPTPRALFMDGTTRPLEDLVAGVERGVLVTRFWYVRGVKPDQTLVTGMTRDGTFWIEDGKIAHPVRSLRFNDTCLGMFSRIEAMGTPERCTGTEAGVGFFPPLVVRDWNYVGVTEF